MVDLADWITLYGSSRLEVKVRAARSLLHRASEVPLSLLLDILDELSDAGLGAETEKALLKRNDPELFDEMIKRLDAGDSFIREVGCNVLGRLGDNRATLYLLKRLADPHVMVRREAGFALAFLKDPSAIPELKRQYEMRKDDDINVRMALEAALKNLGVEFERHPR